MEAFCSRLRPPVPCRGDRAPPRSRQWCAGCSNEAGMDWCKAVLFRRKRFENLSARHCRPTSGACENRKLGRLVWRASRSVTRHLADESFVLDDLFIFGAVGNVVPYLFELARQRQFVRPFECCQCPILLTSEIGDESKSHMRLSVKW